MNLDGIKAALGLSSTSKISKGTEETSSSDGKSISKLQQKAEVFKDKAEIKLRQAIFATGRLFLGRNNEKLNAFDYGTTIKQRAMNKPELDLLNKAAETATLRKMAESLESKSPNESKPSELNVKNATQTDSKPSQLDSKPILPEAKELEAKKTNLEAKEAKLVLKENQLIKDEGLLAMRQKNLQGIIPVNDHLQITRDLTAARTKLSEVRPKLAEIRSNIDEVKNQLASIKAKQDERIQSKSLPIPPQREKIEKQISELEEKQKILKEEHTTLRNIHKTLEDTDKKKVSAQNQLNKIKELQKVRGELENLNQSLKSLSTPQSSIESSKTEATETTYDYQHMRKLLDENQQIFSEILINKYKIDIPPIGIYQSFLSNKGEGFDPDQAIEIKDDLDAFLEKLKNIQDEKDNWAASFIG